MTAAVDWKTAHKALTDWVKDNVEGIGDRVIWENISAPQPAYPYISLLRGNEIDEGGHDEQRTKTLDQNDVEYDPDDPLSVPTVVELTTYQPVVFLVSVQMHTDEDNGAYTPDCNASAKLSTLKRTLGKNSVNESFYAAGMSIVNHESVLDISLPINGKYLSRAILDVTFRTASVLTERSEFFDKVGITSAELGIDLRIDAS